MKKTFKQKKEEIIEKIAIAYHKLLLSIDWKDDLLVKGIKEGLSKFLSNAYLSLTDKHKYEFVDYHSEKALRKVRRKSYKNLVFEHMIPKEKYIQAPCIEQAKNGTIQLSFIKERLEKYWYLAVVTKEEDKLLTKNDMPENWDGVNIFDRYDIAGIKLIYNQKFH
jgi:uncharacterized UPF0160 family protein